MIATPSIGRDVPIAITAEPMDASRCRFVVDRPLYFDRWAYFARVEEAREVAPLAERLFAIDGVTAVLIAHDRVTVTRVPPGGIPVVGAALRKLRALMGDRNVGAESWPSLARSIGTILRDHLTSGQPAIVEPGPVVPSEDELRFRIQGVLDEQVNPVIASHGGGVTIIGVKDNVLYLQMLGGCQGCGLADMTLKHGVEAVVRESIPEIGEIFDLTDHASGRNPYHKPR